MTIQSYLDTLNLRYKTGISREHTYRGDLQTLLMSILHDILVTNEPLMSRSMTHFSPELVTHFHAGFFNIPNNIKLKTASEI
jgi:hypothetical protein